MKHKLIKHITIALSCLGLAACSSSKEEPKSAIDPTSISGELIISNIGITPNNMQALRDAGDAFTEEYANVSLTYIENKPEDQRKSIEQTLQTNAPDVIAWYPGNPMDRLVDADLLDDVSDIWATNQLADNMSAFTNSLSKDGKQWGIPITTYGWGVYYRKDIFESLGIDEPTTWVEFQNAAETLKSNNVAPLTIGTKFLWPAGGVFDYLNLRINGHEIHNDLTAGKIKYTDERIRSAFSTWQEMIDNNYFIEGHQDMSWLDAVKPLAEGEAGMYLMGNFLVSQYTQAAGSADNLGFFAFPQIDNNVASAEVAPTEAFFLPRNANNKTAARAFLSFISRPEIQSQWNKTLEQLPPHNNAELTDNIFFTNTALTIRSTTNLSQFFDRDAPESMAIPALEGFQEFMLDTTKLDSILMRLDEVQATAN